MDQLTPHFTGNSVSRNCSSRRSETQQLYAQTRSAFFPPLQPSKIVERTESFCGNETVGAEGGGNVILSDDEIES